MTARDTVPEAAGLRAGRSAGFHAARPAELPTGRRTTADTEVGRFRRTESRHGAPPEVPAGLRTVVKRDGRRVLFDVHRLEATFERAAAGLGERVSVSELVRETLRNVGDGLATADVVRAAELAAAAFIERDPDYCKVAARLVLLALYREVFAASIDDEGFDTTYRSAFRRGIDSGLAAELLDTRMERFDLDRLAGALRPERDLELGYLGVRTLADRYVARLDGAAEEDGRRAPRGARRVVGRPLQGPVVLETPQAFWMRCAMGLALEEDEPTARALEFYDAMSRLLYIPSTPTLFHAGTRHPQLSSCYLTTIRDDLEHIFKSFSDNAQLSKWSGGLGNDWTNVRATGARIHSTQVESQGVVPFLKIANDVTMAINRSGRRRGAACAYLENWHFDVEDFLDLRRNTGDERRRTHDMNTALWIPDLFLERVEEDGEWTLLSPDEAPDLHHLYGRRFAEAYRGYEEAARNGELRVSKTVSARWLWRRMLTALYETGHPWITFKDPCNVRSPQDHAGVVHGSNLCTEITLNTSAEETAVCNLGSINLARHVTEDGVDEERLAATVRVAMRMLDNVIDLNFYPTAEARAANQRHRPVGLGVMGLQDALFTLRLPFEGEETVARVDALMERIAHAAYGASCDLAAERGAYASFAGSKWQRGLLPCDTLDLLQEERGRPVEVDRTRRLDWDSLRRRIRRIGMRNSNCLAIAPTATISNIAGCFPSIEPIYRNLYVKANISGEFTVVNRHLVADLERLGLWDEAMLEKLKFHDGDVSALEEIPEEIRALHREAFSIDPFRLVELAAARGKWIDQSQSLNLFVKGTSGKLLSELYLTAWRRGLKTTYYLRTLAASQIEKATLDAGRFGYTQKRPGPEAVSCSLNGEECEACQ